MLTWLYVTKQVIKVIEGKNIKKLIILLLDV